MKNSKLTKLAMLSTVIAGAVVTTQSYAQDGWYLGASATQAFVDERSLDEDDTGAKMFGGYRFNNYMGIEASYYDFGEISSGANELAVEGASIAAVAFLPVSGRFTLLAKAGIHDWDADRTGTVATQLLEDSDTDAFYGVGVEFSFESSLSVRAEVERYEIEDIDIDAVSVGLRYSF